MKIDIITLHYIWHYGSLLQTYATCKVFEKLGLETEVIDYVRPNASETEEINKLKCFFQTFDWIMNNIVMNNPRIGISIF